MRATFFLASEITHFIYIRFFKRRRDRNPGLYIGSSGGRQVEVTEVEEVEVAEGNDAETVDGDGSDGSDGSGGSDGSDGRSIT